VRALEWSVADVLDRLVEPKDKTLAYAARARLHELAARLPAALTRLVYLECWIGQPRPRLDLIAKIDPSDRDALIDFVSVGLPPELRVAPSWVHVGHFAREWAAPGHMFHEAIRAAWLEFDLDPEISPDAALRSPRVFVDFTREAQGSSIADRHHLAVEVVSALSGQRAPEISSSLRSCLAHLPNGAKLAYLSVVARAGHQPVVRACVVGLAGALVDYLGAVGWPGAPNELARGLFEPLAGAQGEDTQPVGVLHLDFAPDVRPRIGLEYTFPRSGMLGGLRAADQFLDQLVARGWCTARNREALRSWPRRSVELLPHDIWHSRATRQIGHVKLTYAPGEPVVAKAYLRATFDLLAGGTLLRGRPRLFGTADMDGALSPSSGGLPPSPVAHRAAAPPLLDLSGAHSFVLVGKEQILTRAAVDLDFRRALLADPRKAILDVLGVRIPSSFCMKFIEREQDVDALIVLPDLQREEGDLEDEDLDAVAGGADTKPPPPW
jgi:hypothetical protein